VAAQLTPTPPPDVFETTPGTTTACSAPAYMRVAGFVQENLAGPDGPCELGLGRDDER
jgi:hypothetical protein